MANDKDYLNSPLALLFQKASHIVAVDELTTYLGFNAREVTGTDETGWAICKVEQSSLTYPNITTVKWVEGQRQKRHIMDNYAGYDYQYPNF